MPVCPTCSTPNPAGFRFCGQCATPLDLATCPYCGASNPGGQGFCGQCGKGLDKMASAAPLVALEERKLATVLFADVVGFTSLAERTDPEEVARLVDVAFRRLAQVVSDHGGTVDKYMGDSVLAVFGVPVAHDEDAERAVAAGLAMRELGGDLAFSIGINSGEVMATAVGGTGEVTVIGDTVNVAARLEKAAGAGEVLCGKLTAQLAGRRVIFRERQALVLKGKREPVEVWEAAALRQAGSDTGGDNDAESPVLVGRQDELAFLEAQWRRVHRDGRTQLVLVCGDAGSGKTRLIDELVGLVGSDAMLVRSSFPAYGPMGGGRVAADIFRQLGPSGDQEVDARVLSISGEMDPSLSSIDPAGIAGEQLWAFGRLLQKKSQGRPVLIVIDDVHLGGDHALELLSSLMGRLRDVGLLVILAGRTDPAGWLNWFPGASTVSLEPLSRNDAVTLAEAFVGEGRLPPDVAGFLAERASGNPLYLRELIATARAQGSLVADGGSYRLRSDATVPPTLRALLAARLDALEANQKGVLQRVALLGEAATSDQVASLGVSDPIPALRDLVAGGLIHQGSGAGHEIKDPLLREVAYETLPRSVRGGLHHQAAVVVDSPEERVRHFDLAAFYLPHDQGVTDEAARVLAQAGEIMARASRNQEAIRLLERAVELGCDEPRFLLALAKTQALVERAGDALATLAHIPDDPDDPAIGLERDHVAANVEVFTDPAQAAGALVKIADRWHELGQTGQEAWAHSNAGVALFNLSRMDEASTELEKGIDLFRQAGDETGAVASSSFLCLARPTDHRVPGWLADALALADAAGDRSKQLTSLVTLTWHHYIRSFCGGVSDTDQAEGFGRRLADLAHELGSAEMAVHGWSLLSIMARNTGRLGLAVDHAAAAEKASANRGNRDPWLAWAASFAATVAAGATGAAPPFPPETSLDPVVIMAGVVIEAELTLAGRLEEALSRFEVTRHWTLLGPISHLYKLHYALALVLAGRGEDAVPWLREAAEAARALGAGSAGSAAEALLAEITGDRATLPPPPQIAGGLADALIVRTHARWGDEAAAATLVRLARTMAMPGLLLSVGR
ncbi:MAG: adenylate/guanylate cyclase domain-containing protein [Acidimicrobiales bacterium]